MSKVAFQSDATDIWNMLRKVRGRRAFDIGANGGLVSRAFAEGFEEVVAVEPAKESYDELIEDIPPNVRPLNVAVSAMAGELTLRETSLTAAMGELFTDDTLPWGTHVGYRTVEAVTLDDLTATYGQPDMVKIDTEGHEVQVMRGGGTTFLDPSCRFVIECHSAAKGAEVRSILTHLGCYYEVHYHEAYRESSPTRLEHYWLSSDTGGMLA